MNSSPKPPSSLRAWWYLVRLSWARQAQATWLVWIALALLGLTWLLVSLNAGQGRWSMNHWRHPRRIGPTFQEIQSWTQRTAYLPWDPATQTGMLAANAGFQAALDLGSGFLVFSNFLVFSVFATFLLPLWTLSFATEGLGREREAGNLLWVLTRPLSRPAIFLGKYLALLPWCLLLNLGGFAILCGAAGRPGWLALQVYWPSLLMGTFAFAALFHAFAAWARRPALLALLYAFFMETVAGNLPGHLKRLSVSFYLRCSMFDRAHEFNIRPERPLQYLPVDGTTAWVMLVLITLVFLALGCWWFSRQEYLEG